MLALTNDQNPKMNRDACWWDLMSRTNSAIIAILRVLIKNVFLKVMSAFWVIKVNFISILLLSDKPTGPSTALSNSGFIILQHRLDNFVNLLKIESVRCCAKKHWYSQGCSLSAQKSSIVLPWERAHTWGCTAIEGFVGCISVIWSVYRRGLHCSGMM